MGRIFIILYVVAACCIQWGCNDVPEEPAVTTEPQVLLIDGKDTIKVYKVFRDNRFIYVTNKGGVCTYYRH